MRDMVEALGGKLEVSAVRERRVLARRLTCSDEHTSPLQPDEPALA
jgi:hypothetical protein